VSEPWVTTAIFALTYLGLAAGQVPGLRIDRAGIALVGGTAMLVAGLLSFADAFSAATINYEALALLFGMMVVVGYLRLSGFFAHLTRWALGLVHSPRALLAATLAAAGGLSAVLINDVVCVALTPLVLRLARRLRFDPVPHLIGLAVASNIGSTAAITGNPQNIIIGTASRISYLRFTARLAPVALLGLALAYVVIVVAYRRRLEAPPAEGGEIDREEVVPEGRAHARLRTKTVVVLLVTVVLFCAVPSEHLAQVALAAACVMLAGRVNVDKAYRLVDWPLLVMFAGLFIVVRAFRVHVVEGWQVENWSWLRESPVALLSLLSAGLSNLVSNVPAVLLFEPVVRALPAEQHESAWLALAMSSTLAGNLTVLGSVANLIVVEGARRQGVEISFVEYCKVGVPLTVLTLALGVGWLGLVRY
jgi:Na+/H+ antiporter NhaD/arsenite permease-like protein